MKLFRKSLFLITVLVACNGTEKSDLDGKEELSKPLSEISGMVGDGDKLWAITDKPKAILYKLNLKGKVEQEISIKNVEATDIEAVTKDDEFVFLGDVGDNDGKREERQIIKIAKNKIGSKNKTELEGEVITFQFANSETVEKKKKNNYDCEAILSFKDSLYLFTKRREDLQTELFSLSKTPGKHVARSISIYNSHGLITDAAINNANNEVALIGYGKGHKFPFILLFTDFNGSNFFTNQCERIELADKPWDWQLESFTYNTDNKVYFACEQTKEVKSTLYVIDRQKLSRLQKKK